MIRGRDTASTAVEDTCTRLRDTGGTLMTHRGCARTSEFGFL